MLQRPLVLPEADAATIAECYRAAIGADGTLYLPVDISAIADRMMFSGIGWTYPFLFDGNDIVIYNTQGILMQLLGPEQADIFAIADPGAPHSFELIYDRHEFETYRAEHSHEGGYGLDPDDPEWHSDGTRHIDHDHLVIAIQGVRGVRGCTESRRRHLPSPWTSPPSFPRVTRAPWPRRRSRGVTSVTAMMMTALPLLPWATRLLNKKGQTGIAYQTPNTVMKPIAEHQAVRSAIPSVYGCLIAALAVSALAATTVMGIRATSWSGTSFPGFFVLPNRVVASIGQPHWAGTKDGSLYQRTVVAVDGAPVADSAEVYQRIGQRPSGSTFAVTVQQGSTTDTVSLRSMEFSWGDYSAIFGAYLATGVLYLMMGLLGRVATSRHAPRTGTSLRRQLWRNLHALRHRHLRTLRRLSHPRAGGGVLPCGSRLPGPRLPARARHARQTGGGRGLLDLTGARHSLPASPRPARRLLGHARGVGNLPGTRLARPHGEPRRALLERR